MIRVERATPRDFERVLPLLLEGFSQPPLPTERWRSLFYYPWPCDEDTRGFLLLDGEKVAGFFGTILFEREINGRVEKFANLTTWVTLPEYRNHSLRLFQAVTGIEGRTLTCLSVRDAILPLYLRCGFREMENKVRILFPFPSFRHPLSWLRYRITANPDIIRRKLTGASLEVFEHHCRDPFLHLLIYNRREYCHVVFHRTRGCRFAFTEVDCISNKQIFLKNLDPIHLRLSLEGRALFVSIPGRFLGDNPLLWSREGKVHRQVFKSATLQPSQIDNLYTERDLLYL